MVSELIKKKAKEVSAEMQKKSSLKGVENIFEFTTTYGVNSGWSKYHFVNYPEHLLMIGEEV